MASNILGLVLDDRSLKDDGLDFGSGHDRRRSSHRLDGMRQKENPLGCRRSDPIEDARVMRHV